MVCVPVTIVSLLVVMLCVPVTIESLPVIMWVPITLLCVPVIMLCVPVIRMSVLFIENVIMNKNCNKKYRYQFFLLFAK